MFPRATTSKLSISTITRSEKEHKKVEVGDLAVAGPSKPPIEPVHRKMLPAKSVSTASVVNPRRMSLLKVPLRNNRNINKQPVTAVEVEKIRRVTSGEMARCAVKKSSTVAHYMRSTASSRGRRRIKDDASVQKTSGIIKISEPKKTTKGTGGFRKRVFEKSNVKNEELSSRQLSAPDIGNPEKDGLLSNTSKECVLEKACNGGREFEDVSDGNLSWPEDDFSGGSVLPEEVQQQLQDEMPLGATFSAFVDKTSSNEETQETLELDIDDGSDEDGPLPSLAWETICRRSYPSEATSADVSDVDLDKSGGFCEPNEEAITTEDQEIYDVEKENLTPVPPFTECKSKDSNLMAPPSMITPSSDDGNFYTPIGKCFDPAPTPVSRLCLNLKHLNLHE